MILVDSSVWIDHLRKSDSGLAELLRSGKVLTHPFLIGELALVSLRKRSLLDDISALPAAKVADDLEVLRFIGGRKLYGTGIGYVDAHLLASVQMTPDAVLWTRDKRLLAAAVRLSIDYKPVVN